MQGTVRLIIGLLLALCAPVALAQSETPAAPPAADAAAVSPPAAPEPASTAEAPPVTEAAPSAATPSGADAAPAATAAPEVAGVLVLPPEFIVYQQAVGATEAVPEWTQAAQSNLATAARSTLTADSRFRLIESPELEAAEREVFREHVELFKIIAMNLDSVVKLGGKPWQGVRDNADFRVGDGLGFIKQKTGARYALVMAGAQVKQTGGSIFMQLAIAGLLGAYIPGGGTYLYCGLIDLQTGQLSWYNSIQGVSVYGMGGGASARDDAGAGKLIANLFKTYPASPGLRMATLDAAVMPAPAAPAAAEPVAPAPDPSGTAP